MGHPSPQQCFITDARTSDVPSDLDAYEYNVQFGGDQYFFRFPGDHQNSEYVERNKHILKGLLLNGKLPSNIMQGNSGDPGFAYDNETLAEIIKTALIPRTPKEKSEFLLKTLFNHQSFDGQYLDENIDFSVEELPYCFYLKNPDEFWFYFFGLRQSEFIACRDLDFSGKGLPVDSIQITPTGLEKVISLENEGQLSNNCFVAMAFDENTKDARDAIKSALDETGFRPIIIDEEFIQSDKTINDAIFAGIRNSRFCISDFSFHRNGVYFEAGFALGLGRPVIYICSEEEFKNAHFDIKPLQHIIYKEPGELKSRLVDKIEAWIK